jgi:polysaccharide export outer membrane protein
MPAAGRNLTDVGQDITTALRKYYVDPKVSVAVKSTKGMKLYVLGEVQRPGLFAVEEPTNVLQAVAMAGGFTENAKRNSILLATGDLQRPSLHKLDLQAALSKGLFAENNPEVQRGDIIYVPATTIANVEIFFRRLSHILSPVVEAERAAIFGSQVPEVIQGEGKRTVVIGP